jgi:hypothetical protein
MTDVYQQFKSHGSSKNGEAKLADFADLTKLMGFESVWDFDRRHQE